MYEITTNHIRHFREAHSPGTPLWRLRATADPIEVGAQLWWIVCCFMVPLENRGCGMVTRDTKEPEGHSEALHSIRSVIVNTAACALLGTGGGARYRRQQRGMPNCPKRERVLASSCGAYPIDLEDHQCAYHLDHLQAAAQHGQI